jgi:multisubunit Na+/H+ antiporter MnhF subunit
MVLAIGVLASNAIAGGWGAVSWLRTRPSVVFWPLLRLAQALVAAQVVLGLLLLARGETSPDGLHIVYGVSPLVVTLVSEGMRVSVAQRELEGIEDVESLGRREQVMIARRVALNEMGVMTVGLLLVLTLALRAYQTGG